MSFSFDERANNTVNSLAFNPFNCYNMFNQKFILKWGPFMFDVKLFDELEALYPDSTQEGGVGRTGSVLCRMTAVCRFIPVGTWA